MLRTLQDSIALRLAILGIVGGVLWAVGLIGQGQRLQYVDSGEPIGMSRSELSEAGVTTLAAAPATGAVSHATKISRRKAIRIASSEPIVRDLSTIGSALGIGSSGLVWVVKFDPQGRDFSASHGPARAPSPETKFVTHLLLVVIDADTGLVQSTSALTRMILP